MSGSELTAVRYEYEYVPKLGRLGARRTVRGRRVSDSRGGWYSCKERQSQSQSQRQSYRDSHTEAIKQRQTERQRDREAEWFVCVAEQGCSTGHMEPQGEQMAVPFAGDGEPSPPPPPPLFPSVASLPSRLYAPSLPRRCVVGSGVRIALSVSVLFAGAAGEGGEGETVVEDREQDKFLPIANISRIMKRALPENAKIAKDAKETVQECVSEFISFITSEASDKCQREKRKTIMGDDLLWAMTTLGFENYTEPLKTYLFRYREVSIKTGGKEGGEDGGNAGGSGEAETGEDPASPKGSVEDDAGTA